MWGVNRIRYFCSLWFNCSKFLKLGNLSVGEESGIFSVVVKCVDIRCLLFI